MISVDIGRTDKVAIVTAGVSGIGAAIALALACKTAVAEVARRMTKIDVLVNNGGFNDGIGLGAGPSQFRASLDRALAT